MSDFAKEIKDRWTAAESADRDNRDEARLDLEFAAGKQWDERVREYREAAKPFPLPCLTINTLPQFIGQVTGDRLANDTAIKALPTEENDKDVADVRSELIRSIEIRSKAHRAYNKAFENEVTCGVGNFRIDLDYAHEETFDRDLFIRSIPNALAVLWDPMAADPTGRDAEYCFVQERIRKDEYKRRFKDAGEPTLLGLGDYSAAGSGWVDSETVRIAEYWQMTTKPRTIVMLQDGSVKDVTDKPESDYRELVLINPSNGKPYMREVDCKYAKRILTNGREELDDPFEFKLFRLPIIRCLGREVWIEEERVRFGLVRFARDPQRLKNYWRSVVAELLMGAPRDNYVAPAKAIKGREADWPKTRVYNDDAPVPPTPVTQANLGAILTEAQMCAQDMKDVTGLHDASLGMRSNETSGVAIQRRQHEGDISSIGYHDTMNSAMEEAGEVLNALIPVVFDTVRTIRIIGDDEAVKFLRINDPMDPESVNLATGRFDVRIATGPRYMTRRQEAADSMMEATNRAPQLMAVAGDLIAKAQDWPDADKIADRLKKTLPPELREEDEENANPAAQAAKMEAEAATRTMAELEMRLKVAQVDEAEAKARKAIAEAEAAEEGASDQNIKAHGAETNRIKAITAKGFPLGPEAAEMLQPLVGQAVMQVLASPDILPMIEAMQSVDPIASLAMQGNGAGPMPAGEGTEL